MKNYVYYAGNGNISTETGLLAAGFGFRQDGAWRGGTPLPEAAGLLVDDRFPPSLRGAEAAAGALRGYGGVIVLDFERPPGPGAERLARLLAGQRVVTPPGLAALPHAAVLAGPWRGGPFDRWLEAQQARYGALVLDGLPLLVRGRPGQPWTPWTGPPPAAGFPCPGAGCLHRRLADGSVLLWDTKATLAARCRAAGVAVIVFAADWEALPP